MRLLGQLPALAVADRFVDVLFSEGLPAQVSAVATQSSAGLLVDPEMGPELDHRTGPVEVWVLDDAHWQRAKELFAEFHVQPDAPRFLKAAAQGRQRLKDLAAERRERRLSGLDQEASVTGSFPVHRIAKLVLVIVATICLAGWFLSTLLGWGPGISL
jgi:hypothetical protein